LPGIGWGCIDITSVTGDVNEKNRRKQNFSIPVLAVSAAAFNRHVGFCRVVPVTTPQKGLPNPNAEHITFVTPRSCLRQAKVCLLLVGGRPCRACPARSISIKCREPVKMRVSVLALTLAGAVLYILRVLRYGG
jgi:hypothetical protein